MACATFLLFKHTPIGSRCTVADNHARRVFLRVYVLLAAVFFLALLPSLSPQAVSRVI